MARKVLPLVLASVLSAPVSAATFVLQNNDGAGEGFNDPNPPPHANQIGNNPGTTLGEMRLKVFAEAAKVWGDILNSNVTINIGATFDDDLACFPNSATLGQAGASGSWEGFAGSDPNTAYPISLAESLSNSNLNGISVEINARFNSKVDTNDVDCLGGGGFYYGLDDNAPEGTSALFPVVLHELGHGLGFQTLTSSSTGAFIGAGGHPDVFSRNLHALDTGESWDVMTAGERKASALNEPELVWKGAKVTADRALHMGGAAPELLINAPGGIAGTFEALFGNEPTIVIPGNGVTAGVVDGNVFGDGCSSINEASFNGKIILFDATDSCPAVFPAFFSEFDNAVGVIIAETTDRRLPDMSGQIDNQAVTIPYIGVAKSVADDLRANLGTVNITIRPSASNLNGESQGKVKMYAPANLEAGSSVSHWSKSAIPDLLMEPVLGPVDFADVDLTAAAFQDIGWSVNIPGGVVDLIFKDGFE